MKHALKPSFLLLFAFGLMLNLTQCNFMNHAYSHNFIESESSNNGDSNHLNDTHMLNFEEDFFITDSQHNPTELRSSNLLLSFLNENYSISFPNSIWQPPKSV